MKSTIIFLLVVFSAISVRSFSAESNFVFSSTAKYDNPASIKGIVRATTGGASGRTSVIANAKLTLTNRALPNFLLTTVSGNDGSFIFNNLPAGTYTLTAESAGLPTAAREINLALGAALTVEINLTVEVAETVTVRDEEGLLSTSETTTSNVVCAETLKSQPFRTDNYQSALPLTPGVVNDAKGNSYVKGTRAGQSGYTVNGVDVTDPVTGESSFNLPLEAAASVQIEENPYSAEFGNFTGGVTNLQTKGGDKFKVSGARFFPTFHNIFSTQIDSFRPRLTFSGPVIKNRLTFLQSFEYRFTRFFVPSQPKPLDNTALEGFYAFTQLDYTLNKSNVLKFNLAVFPQKTRFYGLDTFNPAETTPNLKQRGYLVSVSEQAVFKNASFLSSTLSYKSSDADVFGQGSQPLTISPEVNRGNYFADMRRQTNRLQIQETYYFKPFNFKGQHSLKTGIDYNHTKVSGQFRYNPIFLRRLDNSLAQRIDFTNTDPFGYDYNEIGAFVQDRWVLNPKLTIDAGLRFDLDGISKSNNIAPRISFLFSPFKNNRTIVRGGVGLFYDRTLPGAGYFDERFAEVPDDDDLPSGSTNNISQINNVPERIVTNFAADGATVIGSPRFFSNEIGGVIKSPRSLRWSLQFERGITKNLTARVGFLQRKTTNELLVEPIFTNANSGQILLSSNGKSSYRELQFLVNYNQPRFGLWNISYVFSKTRGDLNTADKFLGDFPVFVVRPNEYSRLSFDAPHRFLLYGQVDLPFDIRVAPLFEVHSGFPFSAVNERLEYVGAGNQAGRFPTYLSLDMQITKGIPIPFFDNKRARVGVALFNLTNHFNPRDVQNNIASPNYGNFYNNLGISVKAKFELGF